MGDIYDEEFNRHLQLAQSLIMSLQTKKDRDICRKWIKKLCSLRSDDTTVKKNRNAFFLYMLRIILQVTSRVHSPDDGMPYFDQMYQPSKLDPFTELEFMKKWSDDKRTYVAAQPLPGRGALVYMAVAKDPSLGWDHPTKNGQNQN